MSCVSIPQRECKVSRSSQEQPLGAGEVGDVDTAGEVDLSLSHTEQGCSSLHRNVEWSSPLFLRVNTSEYLATSIPDDYHHVSLA
jgi:hypothetical protein